MHTRASISVLCISLFTTSARAQTTWYVDDDGDPANGCTSWDDACPELQMALSLADDGTEIRVAGGTYKPDFDVSTGQHTGDRNATFQLISGVAVRGGFLGMNAAKGEDPNAHEPSVYETILTGDLLGNDGPIFANGENSLHVVTGSGANNTAILEGFTVTAGNASEVFDRSGAGMFTIAGDPVVSHCLFSGNRASSVGGGMMNAPGANPLVRHCTFSENRANSGAGMFNNGSPWVENCLFVDNDGPGMSNTSSFGAVIRQCTFMGNEGGLGTQNSTPLIVGCAFRENSLAGLGVGSDSDVVVIDSVFQGNQEAGMVTSGSTSLVVNCMFLGNQGMNGGGIASNSGHVTLVNCLFYGNNATTSGAGIWSSGHSTTATVTNCTFTGNTAGLRGGALFATQGAEVSVSNTTLWSNSAPDGPEIYVSTTGNLSILYSDVRGGEDAVFVGDGGVLNWGEGNIDADPLFVDPAFGDLRLLAGSPCIDAADNTAVPKGVVMDLDGNPRFVDDPDTDDTGFGEPPIVDMGAYEFQFQDPCADDDGDGRVTICHIPPGNPDNAHTITVSVNAVPDHLAHGDYCGSCEGGLSADLETGWILGAQGMLGTRGSVAPVVRERRP